MQRAKRRLGPIVCLSRGDAANSGQAKADPAGDEDYHAAAACGTPAQGAVHSTQAIS